MAILVDDAIWSWRGRKWAHLVSDSRLDELHDFAHRIGVPYVAFQDDHYDIHADLRLRALAQGAHPVTSRQVVASLRSAGLRRPGPVEAWRWQWRVPAHRLDGELLSEDLSAEALVDQIRLASAQLAGHRGAAEIGSAQRAAERLVVVSTPETVPIEPGLTVLDERTTLHRSSGERGTFVELRRWG